MKKIFILAVSILFTGSVFAQSAMQDRVDNWTNREGMTRDGAGVGPEGPEGPGSNPGAPAPAGDTAWALILAMGTAYGAFIVAKKRKTVKE